MMLLFVGSGFKTKGLDRCLTALAALPDGVRDRTRLIVVGQDNTVPFERIARSYGIAEKVRFLGGRSDIPDLLAAGDLLVHPAYSENTGLPMPRIGTLAGGEAIGHDDGCNATEC